MDTFQTRLTQPHVSDMAKFDAQVDHLVAEIVRSLEQELQRQPASMVYELLRGYVARRLPGVEVDEEPLRDAAARISAGIPTRMSA